MESILTVYEGIINISNLKVERVEMAPRTLNIYCEIINEESPRCPTCGLQVTNKRIKYRRKVRDLDISGRQVFLQLLVHQHTCTCGRCFSESFDFVEPNKGHTKRQAKYIFEMSAKQSHYQVAALTDTCHKTVERICNNYSVDREVDWSKVYRIGIDEFAFKKGHKDFITIIINLDTHEILDILPYRDKASLRTYFQSIKHGFCEQLKEFCSDMWGPFQDLAKELFPNALIHVDRFHWTGHLNNMLDDFRKQLRREDKDQDAFKLLKWKLIKRPENLTDKEKLALQSAFEVSSELEDIYELRNTFLNIFDNKFSFDFAVKQIDFWLEHADQFKNKYVDKFISLFGRHRENILNYLKTRLSSGVVEGKNNLLRTVKRFTFNMSNFENFKSRVFAYEQ